MQMVSATHAFELVENNIPQKLIYLPASNALSDPKVLGKGPRGVFIGLILSPECGLASS
jgi:hypothetical protein